MTALSRASPASLQAATAAETAYGGVEDTWTEIAVLWVARVLAAPADQVDGAVSAPSDMDSASAVARDHPAALAGQRLVIGDDPDPWRIRRVDRAVPSIGRMTLRLDRLL